LLNRRLPYLTRARLKKLPARSLDAAWVGTSSGARSEQRVERTDDSPFRTCAGIASVTVTRIHRDCMPYRTAVGSWRVGRVCSRATWQRLNGRSHTVDELVFGKLLHHIFLRSCLVQLWR
jgi:hypothetical protein